MIYNKKLSYSKKAIDRADFAKTYSVACFLMETDKLLIKKFYQDAITNFNSIFNY